MSDEFLTEKFLKAFGKKRYEIIYDVRKINDTEWTVCSFIKNNLTDSIDINFLIFDDENKKQVVDEWAKQFNKNDYEFYNAIVELSDCKMFAIMHDARQKKYFLEIGKNCFEKFIKQNMSVVLMGDNSVYCTLADRESISELLNHEKYYELVSSFNWLCGLSEEVREWCES